MKKIELDSAYISPKAISYVNRILDGYIKGEEINPRQAFEKRVGEYLGVKHAYACNSGTDALHIALLALNIPEGSEVITNPLTNIATISAILKCRCIPVFSMVNKDGFFDEKDLKKRITGKTKAIIPVHFSGNSEDLERLTKIAREHGLFILEDACQAFGSALKIDGVWKHLGAIGDVGVYSFGGGKVLSTMEGGMVITNDQYIADRVNKLTGTGDYSNTKFILGFNSRLDALRSAVGLANLKDLSQNIGARKKVWFRYQESLSNYPWVKAMPVKDRLRINYSSFVLKVGSKKIKEILFSLLRDVNYHISVERQKDQPNAYTASGPLDKRIVKAIDGVYESHVSLPTHGNMGSNDVENILGCFHKLDKLLKN